MDFDLNESFDPQFPYSEADFQNGQFSWDINYDEPLNYDLQEDGGSPILPNNVENSQHIQSGSCSQPSNVGNSDYEETSDRNVEAPTGGCGDDVELEDEDLFGEEEESLGLQIENRLAPGSKLDDLDQIYYLYKEYGRLEGFSVKKSTQKYSNKTDEVLKKDYRCSSDGKSNAKQLTERLREYKKQDNRCKCQAKLRVVRQKDGKWMVTVFTKEHNHELADKEYSYMLRSCRDMTMLQKCTIEALHSSGIRIKDAFRFMVNSAGGNANVGFIRKDAYNHMDRKRRKSKLDDADANSLVKHFMEKSNKEPFFYWNMQTDDEGRVMNLFFRDSRCLVDYEFFGDVLTFDTTYKTNKYQLICAPFVGVNHHMKNCLFGLAFLSDETTATFQWLFNCFLESMGGKEPEVVFTDQCRASMKALDSEFKSSSNRLCQWHINQNAPSHFGSLNCNNEFKDMWFHCMNGCESVAEFETTWRTMIENYELADNRWFGDMFDLRQRWSSVFTKDKFVAGLHATSRSEVTNKSLKEITSASGNLTEFILKYEQLQHDWRRIEGEDDVASLGVPGLLIEETEVLKNAGKFFTRTVFLSYEYEAAHAITIDIMEETPSVEDPISVVFEVRDKKKSKFFFRKVTYNTITTEATCSCCLWQTVGVLCRHIFRVYLDRRIKVIPDKYMLRRLSRGAKKRRTSDVLTRDQASTEAATSCEDVVFSNHVMRSVYEILHDVKMDFDMKQHFLGSLENLREEMLSMGKKGKNNTRRVPVQSFKNTAEMPRCRDPVIPPKNRHTNTRLSSHWLTKKRGGKKRSGAEKDLPPPSPRARIQRGSSSRFGEMARTSSPSASYTQMPTTDVYMSFSPRGFANPGDPLNFYATQ